jgi:hypothetical protein
MRSVRWPLAVLLFPAAALPALAQAVSSAALPPGLARPNAAEASQIIKYTGDTIKCETIVIDTRHRKWAFVAFDPGPRCPQTASGIALVEETMPRNVNTAGLAWTPIYRFASPTVQCPLRKVPAAVSRDFAICTGSSVGQLPGFA